MSDIVPPAFPPTFSPTSPAIFPPTLAAAQARLAAVRPADYARSRNHLDGAATQLSAYLTHGLLTLHDAAATLIARHPLHADHKLLQELGWRAFFHHVWAQRGAAIFDDLHPGPRPAAAYLAELPADVRTGRTGVPAIDQAVRTLYATGHLHNHARMWLASYLVHVRGVHWRAGADWLYGHLLDGDLASNHLSWQWVAGTGSGKPYLFNAESVARWAGPAWQSPGTAIDTGYDTLARWAEAGAPPWRPRAGRAAQADAGGHGDQAEPACLTRPPADLASSATLPAPSQLAGRTVWLVHPWSLGEPPAGLPPDALRLAVWPAEFHARWPWRPARWRFVAARMAALLGEGAAAAPAPVWADSAGLVAALAGAARVVALDNPHLPADWPVAWRQPQPAWPAAVVRPCASFSQFWRAAVPLAVAGVLPPAAPQQQRLFHR